MAWTTTVTASSSIRVTTWGACDQPGDIVGFEVQILDDTLDVSSVEWGTGDAELELTCDPTDEPLCSQITIPCPECAVADRPENSSVFASVVAPDDSIHYWVFFDFAPCSGDENDRVRTQATLCHILEDDTATSIPLTASLCLAIGVVAHRRRRSRKGGAA